MNVGTIISFLADKETHYGQIVFRTERRLTVKILFSDIAVDIENWKEGWRDGIIAIPFNADKSYIDFRKTVVVTCDLESDLPRWKRCWYKLRKIKCGLLPYEDRAFLDEQGRPKLSTGWRLRRKVKGVLFADGVFAPIRFGKFRLCNTFYFEEYNKLKQWQQTTNRSFSMNYVRKRPRGPI